MLRCKQLFLTITLSAALALAACATPPAPPPKPQGTYMPPAVTSPLTSSDKPFQYEQPQGGKVIHVALLIPSTGRNAALGRAMQDAATLALYDKYAALSPTQAATRVEILPKDTGDTTEQAKAAAKAAVDEGAVIVLGPVFSDAVSAAAPIVTAAGKQMISFSNNAAAARPGVYVFGFTPEAQTARIIDYALEQKMQVGAMVPNNVFGQKVLEVAKKEASGQSAAIAPVSLYLPQGLGIDKSVDALMAGGAHFNALFVPEAGPALDTIQRTLSARGVNADMQLLGTGMWDDPDVIRAHNLEGALIASSPPNMTQGFVTRFKNAYGYTPPRIASLAYDAVALTVTLATSDRGFDAQALTNPSGYSGPANGVFRFFPDGTSERALAVLRVQSGQLQTVVPAPVMFK